MVNSTQSLWRLSWVTPVAPLAHGPWYRYLPVSMVLTGTTFLLSLFLLRHPVRPAGELPGASECLWQTAWYHITLTVSCKDIQLAQTARGHGVRHLCYSVLARLMRSCIVCMLLARSPLSGVGLVKRVYVHGCVRLSYGICIAIS